MESKVGNHNNLGRLKIYQIPGIPKLSKQYGTYEAWRYRFTSSKAKALLSPTSPRWGECRSCSSWPGGEPAQCFEHGPPASQRRRSFGVNLVKWAPKKVVQSN